jgi:inhibitor of KinA
VSTPAFRVIRAGDSAVFVQLEERIDPAINAHAIRLARAVDAARVVGVRDVVPTYHSVAVYFDPLRTDFAGLSDLLSNAAQRTAQDTANSGPIGGSETAAVVRIPVSYGGDDGPDLGEVAAFAQMSAADVVARHAGRTYRVFMMGFVPGFPYMGTVDPAIAAPRRSTPRLRVPAGSGGIAGSQTGIYPAETPGGWQLIGRTRLQLFDLARPEPFLLKPGDTVEFYPEQ